MAFNIYNPDAPLCTLKQLKDAQKIVDSSPHKVCTPMLHHVQKMFNMKNIDLYLKLENMQTTGSFKIRGIIHQFSCLPEGCGSESHPLVTMSAGNYGKAFAFYASHLGMKGTVIMPVTAPDNRATIIQGYGITVERAPTSKLTNVVEQHVKNDDMVYLHSYDDPTLFGGYASLGFEILNEVADPDIVLVCCGGGGLLSGTAAAIKLSLQDKACRIYGVEPKGSCTMYESYRQGKAVAMDTSSVASGLSPPSAGSNTYKHCKEYVDDILLVSDEEILSAMFALYDRGLLVEPSGSAAFAALYHQKVPNTENKKIVVVLTRGNVTPEELSKHSKTMERS